MTTSRRLRVDEALTELDVVFLQRKGFLGTHTPWRLTREGHTLTMRCEVLEDGDSRSLVFRGTITPKNGVAERFVRRVGLTRVSCLADFRHYFECPSCRERRRKLYVVVSENNWEFACRECCRLTYASAQKSRCPLYTGLLKPQEVYANAMIELHSVRSPERRRRLEEKAEAARVRLERFQQKIEDVARSVIEGNPLGKRDQKIMEDLWGHILGHRRPWIRWRGMRHHRRMVRFLASELKGTGGQ